MSVHANAATKPIFDERPIQGFFNTIDPLRLFSAGPIRVVYTENCALAERKLCARVARSQIAR
jgi:hypothetical protein